MDYLGCLFLGVVIGGGATYWLSTRRLTLKGTANFSGQETHTEEPSSETSDSEDARSMEVRIALAAMVRWHFDPVSINSIVIAERNFSGRMRADLQRVLDTLFVEEFKIHQFFGVRKENSFNPLTLTDCFDEHAHYPPIIAPAEYEELDIGEAQPLRVLKSGLWLVEVESSKLAIMLLAHYSNYGEATRIQIQVGTSASAEDTARVQSFFRTLEDAVAEARSYRGKILSLERSAHSFSGEAAGLMVHKLRQVDRDQVILPERTFVLLERNVINFVHNHARLAQYGMSTKKGLLFYGPPGTGKTHTIHYLIQVLEGYTTLLVSGEQVALLEEYMKLARLLQPSIVVLEDADLIARDRRNMYSPCAESLLNKLLNEMDGLKEEAEILFILTTNRPETLEAALASRPGRIDQAIEFPLPDETGRRKLVTLYAGRALLDDDMITEIVARTKGVSAAFIKELMRRTTQFALERDGSGHILLDDVHQAIEEMLFKGGPLNLSILGAAASAAESPQL